MKWNFVFTSVFLVLFFSFSFFYFLAIGDNVATNTDVTSAAELTQNGYRWYDNTDALTPISALANENTSISTPNQGSVIRLRINLGAGVSVASGLTFSLQFSNSISSGFADITSSTAWTFYDNPGVADGQIIVDTLLSDSTVGESYGESNPSAASPSAFLASQKGEWDWVIRNNSAQTDLNWYFRMIYSSSTVLDSYNRFPTLTAVTVQPATSTPPVTITPPSGGGSLIFPVPTSTLPSKPYKPRPASPCDNLALQVVDLSGDCRVDIIDLSILLYYYEQTGSKISRYDFNSDNEVNFSDISILMFYWTN